ncbi:hypothetical protein [Nitrosomonas supralitoralis]|uniref:Uncharacterized protein n=1 Tax=Nitrosomonas supralitoralis TaxID=2116706 RepID=A0A2P7NSC0_9PROT|nr:hypothetical protein [Nitrosomonas supralitoralis]PSJ16350.1 hypothetical protein C7H79_13915 [Nitrosomonas supralitoralis]
METIIQPLVVIGQQLIVARESNIIERMSNNEQKIQFSKRLNDLCEEKGLPLHGRQSLLRDHFIALGIKMSQESVRKWLMAESIPRHENKIVLCKYFNVLYEWLSTGDGDMRKEPVELISRRELEILEFNEILRKLGDEDFYRVKNVGKDLASYLLEKVSEKEKN